MSDKIRLVYLLFNLLSTSKESYDSSLTNCVQKGILKSISLFQTTELEQNNDNKVIKFMSY